MARRDDILDIVQRLTFEAGRLPSLEAVARATGLTKQGVLHHFPSRAALDRAVISRALQRVDAEMERAEREGSPLATYLGMSSPVDVDRTAALVITAALRDGTEADLPPEVFESVRRWEHAIAVEVGSEVIAEVARLTGDGLFAEALVTGVAPAPGRVQRLTDFFHDVANVAR